MKKICFLLPVFLLSFTTDENHPLTRVKVTPGLSVMIPKDFQPMDDTDLTERYPSVRNPVAAYTSPDHTIDFSVNVSATQWPDADLTLASEFFLSSLKNLFDRLDVLDQGIYEVNGNKLIYFEFESTEVGDVSQPALESPVVNYSFVQYFVSRHETIVMTFTCPRHYEPEWSETARRMMKSVKIRE